MLSRSSVEKSFYLFSTNRPMTASSLFQLKMLSCFMLGNRTLNTRSDWRIKWRKHSISLGYLSLQWGFTQLNCLLLFKQLLPLFQLTERYKLFISSQVSAQRNVFYSYTSAESIAEEKKEHSSIELFFLKITFPYANNKRSTTKLLNYTSRYVPKCLGLTIQ